MLIGSVIAFHISNDTDNRDDTGHRVLFVLPCHVDISFMDSVVFVCHLAHESKNMLVPRSSVGCSALFCSLAMDVSELYSSDPSSRQNSRLKYCAPTLVTTAGDGIFFCDYSAFHST